MFISDSSTEFREFDPSEIPYNYEKSMKLFKLIRIHSYSSFIDFKEFWESTSEIFNMAKRDDSSRTVNKPKIL
jgi:hypothetical protein